MGNPDHEYITNPNLPHREVPFGTARTTDTGPDELSNGQVMLISLLVCSALFLLLLIIYCYLRDLHHRQRRRRLAHWQQPRLFFSSRAKPSPSRLDQDIIDSIPVIEHSLHGDDKVPESCAVCISEFTDGEKLRALPQCGHRFHLECIDMWFSSHPTCPLCRADINSSSLNSDQQEQLRETENKELCSVHGSSLDRMV